MFVVSLVPRPVSSTKASPKNVIGWEESTEWITILGDDEVNEENINRKQSSHKKGPIVEPWPGPNSKHSGVLA